MKIGLIIQDFNFEADLNEFDYLIGVDRGAFMAYLHNVKIDLAIGDFDSIRPSELEKISNYTKMIKLNPIKDMTDTAEAISYAFNLSSDVTMLGGIEGRRIEHFIANLCLLKRYPKLKILNQNSLIFLANKESCMPSNYKFVSFFALEDVKNLSLSGFKYNLSNYNLKQYDPLCISNEIIAKNNLVKYNDGSLMVILTKDDKIS
jgi:thiamine diphosphokinase